MLRIYLKIIWWGWGSGKKFRRNKNLHDSFSSYLMCQWGHGEHSILVCIMTNLTPYFDVCLMLTLLSVTFPLPIVPHICTSWEEGPVFPPFGTCRRFNPCNKNPCQFPFFTLSMHFKPVWDACPPLPQRTHDQCNWSEAWVAREFHLQPVFEVSFWVMGSLICRVCANSGWLVSELYPSPQHTSWCQNNSSFTSPTEAS